MAGQGNDRDAGSKRPDTSARRADTAGLALRMVQPAPVSIGLEPIVVLWLMPMPIFELFASTTRRIVRGMPPTQADSGHFHHVLVGAGYSVRAICAIYALVSLASCAFGLWAFSRGVPESLMFAGFLLLFALWLWFIRSAASLVRYLPAPLRRLDSPRL